MVALDEFEYSFLTRISDCVWSAELDLLLCFIVRHKSVYSDPIKQFKNNKAQLVKKRLKLCQNDQTKPKWPKRLK